MGEVCGGGEMKAEKRQGFIHDLLLGGEGNPWFPPHCMKH